MMTAPQLRVLTDPMLEPSLFGLPRSRAAGLTEADRRDVRLILISHAGSIARRLEIPGHLYGQARRVLRDKIKTHAIHIGGYGLDLGSRDEGDAV